MAQTKRLRWKKRTFFVLVVFVFTLGALEAGARLHDHFKPDHWSRRFDEQSN